jgi:hypothetical protein
MPLQRHETKECMCSLVSNVAFLSEVDICLSLLFSSMLCQNEFVHVQETDKRVINETVSYECDLY